MRRSWFRNLPVWVSMLVLFVSSALVYWKFRVIDPAPIRVLSPLAADHYTEHHPNMVFGFDALRSGALPLWNPFQLTGTPFLAVPHTGIFYPGNLVYLLFGASLGTEIAYVLHLAFAGLSLWLLGRLLGFGLWGALAAAFTFIWNGWLLTYCNQPSLVVGMCWLPATVLLVEKTIRGSALSAFALVLAVAFQVFNGATEYTTHNLMVGGIYAAFRLVVLARSGEPVTAGKRGALLLACVAAGALLSFIQLLPSLELVAQSGRMTAPLALEEAIQGASIAPQKFLAMALRSSGMVSVGLLPFVGLAFGIGSPRLRSWWLFAACLASVAALLIFGGKVFELYHMTPLGGLFRRPHKFLHVYAFAQSLLAGLALTRLEDWLALRPSEIWSRRSWLAGLGLLLAALAWLSLQGEASVYLIVMLVLLLGYSATLQPQLRRAVIVGLLLVQGTQLFFSGENIWVRPFSQPGIFDSNEKLFDELRTVASGDRIYLSHNYLSHPGLIQKQGMLQQVRVVGGHEGLVLDGASQYFTHVAPLRHGVFGAPQIRFMGMMVLDAESRFKLLDLASTRFYVVNRNKDLGRVLSRAARDPARSGFRLRSIGTDGLAVFERRAALPRAYHVTNARAVLDSDQIFDLLESPEFIAGEMVVLEGDSTLDRSAPEPSKGAAEVRIRVDEPERVIVEVEATHAGYLVLNDAFYPGWKAYVDGHEVEILRANSIFRAVAVAADANEVRFEYAPESFKVGLAVSSATAGGLFFMAIVVFRKGRHSDGQVEPDSLHST